MWFRGEKQTTIYSVKYFGISPLSITLFCTLKLMQKYAIYILSFKRLKIKIKIKIRYFKVLVIEQKK